MKADEQGDAEPPAMLNNFIDFLYIFGHFVRALRTRLLSDDCSLESISRAVKTLRKMTMKAQKWTMSDRYTTTHAG